MINNLSLSERVRPKTLEEFIGQKHILDKGKPLYNIIKNKIFCSMILIGPPATGKTTIGLIIASNLSTNFYQINGTRFNKKEFFNIIDRTNTLTNNIPVIFIDEFHRLNKTQQEILLEPIEKQKAIIIGASTENPYYNLVPALRSRMFIFKFKEFSHKEMEKILLNALRKDSKMKNFKIKFNNNTLVKLIKLSNNPRKLLNTIELIIRGKIENNIKNVNKEISITEDDITGFDFSNISNSTIKDIHYDYISAFIKSIRGSDPDAAIYYLTAMLELGEDPLFIARRLFILAAEDIGLAFPEAINIAASTYYACEKIGMPEAKIVLSNTTILFASLPKSNSTYKALKNCETFLKESKNLFKPPVHLTKLGENDYLYPHNYPLHFVNQKYLEKELNFFSPENLGFEAKIKNWLNKLRKIKENKNL